MTLELRLTQLGFNCWLDQKAETINKQSMAEGVRSSQVFLLFLSEGVLTRPFVLFEIESALKLGKRVMLIHETDGRHGPFVFGGPEAQGAPESIQQLLNTHEVCTARARHLAARPYHLQGSWPQSATVC